MLLEGGALSNTSDTRSSGNTLKRPRVSVVVVLAGDGTRFDVM